ncbi:phosphinothricin acetyltransferase [Burkholderiales bacterium]|nr:phosphinothricin acetyltransferase [Burkholderiales bacterium]
MSEVAIRALAPTDLDAYRLLRLRGLAEHPEAFTSSVGDEAATPADALARRLAPDAARPHDVVLGAFDGGTLVGICGIDVDMREKVRHKGRVFGMYVPAECAGKGIGGALIDRAVGHAHAAGLAQLTLTVTADNAPARRVYERTGFAVCGREPQAIRVGGRGHDKLFMVLFLPAARAPRG